MRMKIWNFNKNLSFLKFFLFVPIFVSSFFLFIFKFSGWRSRCHCPVTIKTRCVRLFILTNRCYFRKNTACQEKPDFPDAHGGISECVGNLWSQEGSNFRQQRNANRWCVRRFSEIKWKGLGANESQNYYFHNSFLWLMKKGWLKQNLNRSLIKEILLRDRSSLPFTNGFNEKASQLPHLLFCKQVLVQAISKLIFRMMTMTL